MNKINLNIIDWNLVQKKHDEGIFWNNLPQMFKISRTALERALKEGYLKKTLYKKIMSDEEKKKISVARIKFLKENPDKHPWKRNSKFKSIPCELFKTKLIENKILFIEEFQPSNDKFYSIDVAFPNKKIGIEINGNQHYNNDGTLKEYYINRNEYLNKIGWNIIDIHYSLVYNDKLINNFILTIKCNGMNIDEFKQYTSDYFIQKTYSKNNKNRNNIYLKRKREILKKEKNKIKLEKLEEIKVNLLSSNINFSKFGWVIKASKIINCNSSKVNSWMKKNMFDFYNENCFKKQKREINYCDCGKEILFASQRCDKCNGINSRKVDRPSIDIITNELIIMGITKVAKKYNVSRHTISKWIGRP